MAHCLTMLPESWPIQSLGDLIAYNAANAAVALKYGQTQFIASNALDISPGGQVALQRWMGLALWREAELDATSL